MIKKLLIANRGEIACRVIATARNRGIRTVAVYSDADRKAAHVALADEAVHIGPSPARDSYLQIDKIIAAARLTGADAVHPGYGFLSENPEFVEACSEAGLIFVGPPAKSVHAMGSKSAAKALMLAAGVPVLGGYHGADQDIDLLCEQARAAGFPLLLKPVAGGGGKGMRIVESDEGLEEAIIATRREAQSSFGNPDLLLERYLARPRHVEVQVFCDQHGNGVYLYERDCSVQRRHQKVIEEAPAPGLSEDERRNFGEAAVRAALAIDYTGAGTVEFLLDTDGSFYFMEMNTRLQVEHPVTEMITGLDLVEWQLRIAEGEALPLPQEKIPRAGHAFELRLYAEDPQNDFLPSTGKIRHLNFPQQDRHTRIDSGIRSGDEISVYYDPMIAKIIVHDTDRDRALHRARLALRATEIAGLKTNRDFLLSICEHQEFIDAGVDTGFIQKHSDALLSPRGIANGAGAAAAAWIVLSRENAVQDCAWTSTPAWRLNLPARELITIASNDAQTQSYRVSHAEADLLVQQEGNEEEVFRVVNRGNSVLELHVGGHMQLASVTTAGDAIDIFIDGSPAGFTHVDPRKPVLSDDAGAGSLSAPMPGTVMQVLVEVGDQVEAGEALLILEAMKMEHTVRASVSGRIASIHFQAGDTVPQEGLALLSIDTADE